ncbi:NmrA family NAD(P)-binding protein [candidate division CSSED10-310 bacterium]|uniref:NmrA family NAD(P)-binding protein n=1 Tax=candidate division CSSED10-310 bacterium TaxID=2855610 RepID=A0ABV6YY20_UNCC1
MDNAITVLAGATGDLGERIARTLLKRDTKLRIIVRHSSNPGKINKLQSLGAEIAEVDFNSVPELTKACSGGSCVISALSGLRDVIVEAQSLLLDAAIKAGVPRFIPSDYAIDFTKLPPGINRNLDLRREFHQRLDKAPIAATSILNGMFTDLLTGQAPMILFKLHRVVCWEDADQRLDFTTIDDAAEFTAEVALDHSTPRFLRIAGDQSSARGLVDIASEVTGKKFRLFRAGNLKRLETLIKVTRAIIPQSSVLYPPWQGMQYMHNMFSGLAKLEPLDNGRYQGMQWTTVKDVLSAHLSR